MLSGKSGIEETNRGPTMSETAQAIDRLQLRGWAGTQKTRLSDRGGAVLPGATEN